MKAGFVPRDYMFMRNVVHFWISMICIMNFKILEVNTRTEKWCDSADEILEYLVGNDRLRDVITQVKVWSRTI